MTKTKNFIRKTGRALWQILYHCAFIAAAVGAAGLLDLGWHWTSQVFDIPLDWLLTGMLAAGIAWWAVDAARVSRAGRREDKGNDA